MFVGLLFVCVFVFVCCVCLLVFYRATSPRALRPSKSVQRHEPTAHQVGWLIGSIAWEGWLVGSLVVVCFVLFGVS